MKDFIYYAPTQVVFGALSEDKTGKLVKQYGGTKVLVIMVDRVRSVPVCWIKYAGHWRRKVLLT